MVLTKFVTPQNFFFNIYTFSIFELSFYKFKSLFFCNNN